jgi:hypothetical protein
MAYIETAIFKKRQLQNTTTLVSDPLIRIIGC